MSKKKIVGISLAAFVLLIVAVLTFFVIKNINEKPPVVVDQNVDTASNEASLSSNIPETVFNATLKGTDDIHWGQGEIRVVDNQVTPKLSFQEDFKVAQGPDLFVYLSPNAAGEDLGEFASLGALKANEGAQEYILPTNYKDYKTVVIWCRAFSVTFATAEFDFS